MAKNRASPCGTTPPFSVNGACSVRRAGAKPAGDRDAAARRGAGHLRDAVALRRPEQVERVEAGSEAVGGAIVGAMGRQQPAPFQPPPRSEPVDIGREPVLAGDVVVMAGEEIAGAVGGGLPVGEGELVMSGHGAKQIE